MNEATVTNNQRARIYRQKARRRAKLYRIAQYTLITLLLALALFLVGYGEGEAFRNGIINH